MVSIALIFVMFLLFWNLEASLKAFDLHKISFKNSNCSLISSFSAAAELSDYDKVDDDVSNVETLVQFLREPGYVVVNTERGNIAVDTESANVVVDTAPANMEVDTAEPLKEIDDSIDSLKKNLSTFISFIQTWFCS